MTQCWHNKYAQQATAIQCTVMPQISIYFNGIASNMHLSQFPSKIQENRLVSETMGDYFDAL